MKTLVLIAGLSFVLPGALLAGDAPKPPVARQVEHRTELNGDTLTDPWFWLRNKPDPEVKAYLDAENAYTDAVMKGTEALQETLYKEIVSHVKETDLSVPYRFGGWLYYTRYEKGKQYPFYCRKKFPAGSGEAEGPEQVVLDVNKMAEGEKFMAVRAYSVSDDGNLLAFSTDNTGFRQYRLQVKNLVTGEILPERVEKATSVAWAADGRTLFYGVEDAAKRPYRIYRHRLGEPVGKDAIVFEEKDERFVSSVSRSRSLRFLYLGSFSHTASEYRFLDAHHPERAWTVLLPREAEHEYYPEDRGDLFWIRTNSGGRNFRLRHGPRREPGEGELEGGSPAPAERHAPGRLRLRELLGRGGAGGWPRPVQGDRLFDRGVEVRHLPRAGLLDPPVRQPRVRHGLLPVPLPVVRHPRLRLRLRREGGDLEAPEGDRGAALRPGPLPLRPDLGRGARRDEGPRLARMEGEVLRGRRRAWPQGRPVPDAPHRVRLLRRRDRSVVQSGPPPAPRPWLRLRLGPRPRRRRSRQAVARRRADDDEEEHLHRLRRRRGRTSSRRR